MIRIDFGCFGSDIASLYEMIVLPSNSEPGKGRGRTPVAITIDSAVTFSLPTCTVFGATTLATPNFDWTLYFLNRPSIPLLSLEATARLLEIICAKSHELWPVKPKVLPWFCTISTRCALVSNALVGMQPQFRQMPPSLSRSTQRTRLPSCPARIAPA